jgi:hypothetical protein
VPLVTYCGKHCTINIVIGCCEVSLSSVDQRLQLSHAFCYLELQCEKNIGVVNLHWTVVQLRATPAFFQGYCMWRAVFYGKIEVQTLPDGNDKGWTLANTGMQKQLYIQLRPSGESNVYKLTRIQYNSPFSRTWRGSTLYRFIEGYSYMYIVGETPFSQTQKWVLFGWTATHPIPFPSTLCDKRTLNPRYIKTLWKRFRWRSKAHKQFQLLTWVKQESPSKQKSRRFLHNAKMSSGQCNFKFQS